VILKFYRKVYLADTEACQCLHLFFSCDMMTMNNNAICRPVSINGCILPVLSSCRDLGVLVSSDLSPSVHIDSIVAKAHQGANVILRCVLSRDVALLTV